jgi:hypothetical protein
VSDADFRSNAVYPSDDFYWPGNEPYVYVDIVSTGCVGGSIKISIKNMVDNAIYGGETGNIDVADQRDIPVNQDNFTLVYRASQEGCASNQPGFIGYGFFGWDCVYTIYIQDAVATNDTPGIDGWTWYENEYGDSNTENSALQYDCNGTVFCDFDYDSPPWTEVIGTDNDNIEISGFTDPDEQIFDNWDDSIPGVESLDNQQYLAPLPGLAGQPTDLGGFLKGLFQVLIIIAGLLAMIMIVLGAITYLSTDAFSGKTEGKDMMMSAIFGLILALGGWVIINTINPNLASSLSIKIPKLKLLEGDSAVYSNTPTSVSGGTGTAYTLPTNIGLFCPGSGGSAQIPAIITSFQGKVAYRWGGKGGALPAGSNYPLSPSEVNNGAYMCTDDSGAKVPCNTFCPAGNTCLDCSGFVNHVRQCAGSAHYPTGTSGMTALSNAEQVDMSQLNSQGTQIGSYVLVPGDILVWNGHVVIYFGNGKIAEAAGGVGGRQKGGNIKIGSIKQYKDDITHILKIQ